MQPGDGDDGNEGVTKRMSKMDGARGQPARPGETNIVSAQHFEHFRPHQPHDQGHLEQAERHRGHDQGLEARDREQASGPPTNPHHFAAAEGGQPAQYHGEQIDQENADQKRRQRNPDERDRLKCVRQKRVAPQRRIDPHQDAEHHREDRRADRKLQRRGQALLQEVRHRLAKLIGDAELELRRVGEIVHELKRDRVVKAERVADRGALGGRGVDGNQLVDGVAGEAEHRKRDDADGNHDAYGLDRPAKSESEHVILSLLSGA